MMLGNLKAEIVKRGLTQTLIAEQMGMSVDSFNARVNGRTDFSLSEMWKLKAEFFDDCSLEYLFAENAAQPTPTKGTPE